MAQIAIPRERRQNKGPIRPESRPESPPRCCLCGSERVFATKPGRAAVFAGKCFACGATEVLIDGTCAICGSDRAAIGDNVVSLRRARQKQLQLARLLLPDVPAQHWCRACWPWRRLAGEAAPPLAAMLAEAVR